MFEAMQVADNDMGAKSPKDVKITGVWWVPILLSQHLTLALLACAGKMGAGTSGGLTTQMSDGGCLGWDLWTSRHTNTCSMNRGENWGFELVCRAG